MGFFKKLFGKDEGKQAGVAPTDLPVKKQLLKGSTVFDLEDPIEEKAWDRRRKWQKLSMERTFDEELDGYEPCRLKAEYRAEVDYVVLDENLLTEGIGNDPVDVALNEVFYVVITEHNSITDDVLDGNMEAYEELLLEELNFAISDWGLRAKHFKLHSIVPMEK